MLFKNAYIFNGKTFIYGGFQVEEGRFARIFTGEAVSDGVDLMGAKVIPGLVDVHIHGSMGADFSDGDAPGLEAMGSYLAKSGVTSFAPASMTLPYEVLAKAYQTGSDYQKNRRPGQARLIGAHMEGPYFSEKKKGAQNGAYLKAPDFEGFKALFEGSGGLIKIVDVAPELPGAAEFAEKASKLCTVSAAHTDSDYESAAEFFRRGASHLTHLFNAMPPIHHRKPGIIGAASEREDVTAELICDGMHVHPSSVRMAFRLFPGRICLVSDALRCCGMPDGEYELGGQTVYLSGGVAKLADGTLAGSATNLHACMKNAIAFGIPEAEAINAATAIPARQAGAGDELGSIAQGKIADFLVCDDELNIREVWMSGERI